MQDEAEASYLQRRAAETCLAAAQLSLAGMYYFGTGALQNHVHACAWLVPSADQGHEGAHEILGCARIRLLAKQFDATGTVASGRRDESPKELTSV